MSEPDSPGQEARPDYYRDSSVEEEPAARPRRRPKPSSDARCAQCGSADISALPMYSIGMGLAYRPIEEDVYCRRCGHSGLPTVAGMPPDAEADGVHSVRRTESG
jgi:hypothetical protein